MKVFSKDEQENIEHLLDGDRGEMFISCLESYILKNSSFASNARDGMTLAMINAFSEGEVNFMKRLINIKRGKNDRRNTNRKSN